jgi:hypothetical protein
MTARHLVIVPLAALLLGGCTSVNQTFTGHEADHVWKAMVVAAERPRYDDWTVRDNYVLVDDAGHRIEIDRRLERTLREPGTAPQQQRQKWTFTVRLKDTEPPRAKFTVRTLAIPVHAQEEGRRYFADVLDLLRTPPADARPDEGATP